ncbi:hypothetical protein NE237_008494 [Protea cynaroides]|uniref:Uncharacterized protein n=1 Tax=Protea cynaroides TaxID=273540 RepID=A0A9Q0QZR1_9MAGN|nr:hypothetical protein NE237_008494 [Protea cynaroides]
MVARCCWVRITDRRWSRDARCCWVRITDKRWSWDAARCGSQTGDGHKMLLGVSHGQEMVTGCEMVLGADRGQEMVARCCWVQIAVRRWSRDAVGCRSWIVDGPLDKWTVYWVRDSSGQMDYLLDRRQGMVLLCVKEDEQDASGRPVRGTKGDFERK